MRKNKLKKKKTEYIFECDQCKSKKEIVKNLHVNRRIHVEKYVNFCSRGTSSKSEPETYNRLVN